MASKIGSLATILWIGLVARILDITDNLIFNQAREIIPKMVFQYIASGLIGLTASRGGGLASVSLGVAIHYRIALISTAVSYAASRKFALLNRRPILSGLVYGAGAYLFMNFVGLPLSAVPPRCEQLRSLQGSTTCSLFCSSSGYRLRSWCAETQREHETRSDISG
jgi:hypothetical protein